MATAWTPDDLAALTCMRRAGGNQECRAATGPDRSPRGVSGYNTETRRQSRALSVRPTRVVTVRLLAGAEALQGPLGGLDGLGAELAEELGGHRPPAGADVGER